VSLETAEIAVAGTGKIWRAPVGTAFPTNISTAVLETAWTELGYTSTGGVRFSFGRNVTEVFGWQSREALRIITKDTPRTIAADFLQFNQNTWATALGGGTWVEQSAGNYQYTPPSDSSIDEFAYIVEASDDAAVYRWCFRKVANISGVDFALTRENPVMLPVTVKVLAADGGLGPFVFQTNDENLGRFQDAGS
jgi:hypothetical protein